MTVGIALRWSALRAVSWKVVGKEVRDQVEEQQFEVGFKRDWTLTLNSPPSPEFSKPGFHSV